MKRKLLRLIILGLLTIAGTFFCLVGCMVVNQDKMIYLPRAYSPADIRQFEREGLVPITFTQEQGAQTAHWLAPRNRPATPFVWLVFTGNGGCATDYLSVAKSGPADCGWLFVDYPGYGACEGRPSPISIRNNATGAVHALAEHLNTTDAGLKSRLGAFGHSIGAAVALDAATEMELKRVVLVSPFTTMKAMAAKYVTPLFTFLLKHNFDNLSNMKRFAEQGGQATILHGANDSMIPMKMGQELAAVAENQTTFIPIEDAGHNDIIARAEREIAKALVP